MAHRSPTGDREDGSVSGRGVDDRDLDVLVHDRIRERSEGRYQRALETLLRPDQILEEPDRPAVVLLQEAGSRGLLDVASPRIEEVAPRRLPPLDLLELLELLDQAPPLPVELGAALGERSRLGVHTLDVGLDPGALGLEDLDPSTNIRELLGESLTLTLGRGETAPERFHLRATTGRELGDPAARVLRLAPALVGRPEGILGLTQLALADGQLVDDPHQLVLGPIELRSDRVKASGPRRLRRERLPRRRPALDRRSEPAFGLGAFARRGPEGDLGVGERSRRQPASVGRLQDLPVQRIEFRAGGRPRLEPLIPARPATLLLLEQRPQAGGGQLAGELLGLGRQGLVLLRHLGLLLQGLQLPAQLAQHVLQPQQVVVEPRELPLSALFAPAVLGDPRGLLDVAPTVLGPGQQDLLELALTHDGV